MPVPKLFSTGFKINELPVQPQIHDFIGKVLLWYTWPVMFPFIFTGLSNISKKKLLETNKDVPIVPLPVETKFFYIS